MTTPRDYRSTHAALAGNVQVMLLNHPDAFEALLYKADLAHPETVAPGVDVVGALDTEERTLEYADPVPCKAMIVPSFDRASRSENCLSTGPTFVHRQLATVHRHAGQHEAPSELSRGPR